MHKPKACHYKSEAKHALANFLQHERTLVAVCSSTTMLLTYHCKNLRIIVGEDYHH